MDTEKISEIKHIFYVTKRKFAANSRRKPVENPKQTQRWYGEGSEKVRAKISPDLENYFSYF